MGSIRMKCSMVDIMDISSTMDTMGMDITATVMVVDITVAMGSAVVVGGCWAVSRVSWVVGAIMPRVLIITREAAGMGIMVVVVAVIMAAMDMDMEVTTILIITTDIMDIDIA